MVRNWILYSMQCVHSHIMTQLLYSMGQQFDRRVEKARTLNEIIDVHRSYVNTLFEHCFQSNNDETIRVGIEQLLNLICVLRNEWIQLEHVMADGADETDYEAISPIDDIENTYIRCHCHVADLLSSEVYSKNRVNCKFFLNAILLVMKCYMIFLSLPVAALSVAFNASCPQ